MRLVGCADRRSRAPLPIRFNERGEPINLSKEGELRIEERLRQQIKMHGQKPKKKYSPSRRPFEQILSDTGSSAMTSGTS
jgi:hypothetical protein